MQQKTKWLLALITASIMIYGCDINKRQIRKLDALTLQQPAEAARLANLINPCFSGKAKSDTVIIKGKPDTIKTPGHSDTVRVPGKPTIITNWLPGEKIYIPTLKQIHDTVPDIRQLTVLNNQIKGQRDSLIVVNTQQASTAKNLNIWRWIAIGGILFAIVTIGLKILGLFSGGAAIAVAKKVL